MGFEDIYKHKPQIKESANARVNLIGEHTDYTGGYVMPTLLGFENTIELARNDEKKFIVFSEHFNEKKISSFSILEIKNNFLYKIIEKPPINLIKDISEEKFISMNIFSFFGDQVYNYLRNCKINKDRGEKEIATAIQNMINDRNESIKVFKICEHVPDLTYKDDIKLLNNLLK